MNDTQIVSEPSTLNMEAVSPSAPGTEAAQPKLIPARFTVSHVADHYRRYPGEPLALFTRVDVHGPTPGFTAQISIPDGLTLGEYTASANHGGGLPEVVFAAGGRFLVWTVERAINPGERFEYQLTATVAHTPTDLELESVAFVVSDSAEGRQQESDSVEIAVKAKGRYLKYLPALYYDDELMGRFLMLFESFWGPIEQQIESVSYYFDPKMTPPDFLDWLASWSDLALDARWPEDRRRKLVSSAARLYRMRGTRQGLAEHLEIFTGRKAAITEHRANNLRLGAEAKLGPSIALGRANRPHSFTVYLRLPSAPLAEGEDESVRARREQDRRRTIESIIESEKPAHTTYTLTIETDEA